MSFLREITRDYISAYRVATSSYKALPIHFIFATIGMLAITALGTAIPYFLRESTNALSHPDYGFSKQSALFFATAYGVSWTGARITEWIKTAFSAAMLARCDAAFQNSYYSHLIRVEYSKLSKLDPGTIASIISRSRAAFSALTFTLFWIIAPTIFQLALTTTVLWRLTGLSFALAFVISMLALFAATWTLAARTKSAHAEIFGASNLLSSHLIEKLGFMTDIKVNDAYGREERSLERILGRYVNQVSRGNARLSLLLALQALLTGIALTVFTVIAAAAVTRGKFSVGDFVMVTGYIVALTAPFTNLAASLSDLRRNHLALCEGFDILALPRESDLSQIAEGTGRGPVFEFCDVTLTLKDREILHKVNLHAYSGEVTVLIGPSGNGKSTVINLMLGLLRPSEGHVKLHGVDISTLSPTAISKIVAVAPQNPLIVSGTLRDNLAFGCEEPPSDDQLLELVDALELRSLTKSSTGNILDATLGVQGRELSGGEKQRVALGRALARRTPIIILDEPTSSLDPLREIRVFEQIRRRVRTIIAVTHREALLNVADRVYRVEHGSVTEFAPKSPDPTAHQRRQHMD
ncbi:ATP-binding cassette domain-containing protein [Burkholderia territorii]|uniref:ATP-binding cassette domain-containing protein n=1 Tax=Burkholderia territorii TaxID=1503055 RepID=UPI000754B063|nr:ABC transporter ATP-binding protein [Burkholderia territorii]